MRSMKSLICRGVALLALGASAGCSWQRFDDVSEKSPVVRLERPKSMRLGFGFGLTTLSSGSSVQLLSTGAPRTQGAAVFELGQGEQPGVDALDAGLCDGSPDPCFLLSRPSAMAQGPSTTAGPLESCFVVGVGTIAENSGLVGYCSGNQRFVWSVPAAAESVVSGDEPVFTDTDDDPGPALIVGAPKYRNAWFYPPHQYSPQELTPAGEAALSYGAAVAVLRTEAGRLLAVGAPEAAQVWLFRSTDEGVRPLGCLSGPPGFGVNLEAGRVTPGDLDDELVVADAVNVSVLDGSALSALPESASSSCSPVAWPEGALLVSFTCGSSKDTSGCQSSEFGASLAIGDLDGDSDGEVLVGAPGMTVRGKPRAGAVLIYDLEGAEPHVFNDIRHLSSADDNDRFGLSIAAPNLGSRHILAVGAPGSESTALFYCSSPRPVDAQGSRCQ